MQERIIFLVLVCAVFLLSAGNSLVEGGRNITFSLLNGESFQKKCCETYYPTQTVFYCNMGGTHYSNSFLYVSLRPLPSKIILPPPNNVPMFTC